ncbi:primase-helicase family protein [Flavobacterium frigidarium]|uniref:primase-helicase family protein n=1 Tax=Flavobacterium frigidarium TaxID=99286 RepID=UPI00041D656F|nr:primase-helicase family protein [Flavobacterium frigidarium]
MSDIPYLRITTSYYKVVQVPTINNQFNESLIKWDVSTIIQDHGRKYLDDIPKFNGKICFPNHFDFSKEIHGFYNTYSPLSHVPKEGDFQNTIIFFKHIFGLQIDLGLDYFKLLYQQPLQILPVLCLVSKERSTGKSSFLKYLKEVFGHNMSYLDSHSLNSNFNMDWGDKLLLGLDEAFLQKEEVTEKIKYLSTSNKNKIEAKGKERFEVDFFGKFVMCSNKEDSFIKIDSDEIRFWVIKVPKLKLEDVHFLNKLIGEIPAFLHYIQNRKFASERKTRMWFTAEQIYTTALQKLFNNNRNRVEQEIAHLFLSVMEKFELDEVNFSLMDLLNALVKTRVKTDLTQLRFLLKKDWKIEQKNNSFKYQKFVILSDGEIVLLDTKGRYFTVTKSFLTKNFDDLMTD